MSRSSHAIRRVSVALACLVTLAPMTAQAATEPGDRPTQGTYLRLDATPGNLLLSPGQSVRWAVSVGLEDEPSPAEVGLSVLVDGPLTEVPEGLTMALDWCPVPSPALSCEDATVVAAPTSVDRLSDVPLEVDDAAGGMLVVTATLPADAADSAQGLEARVSVHAHARGDVPTGQLPDRTAAPGAPAPGEPGDGTPGPGSTPSPAPGAGGGVPDRPEAVSPGTRLPTSGAPLLGPALLALSSVLTGAGLAGARRLRLRRREAVTQP